VLSRPFGAPFDFGRTSPSEDKVLRIKKFASEIFSTNPSHLCCSAKEFTQLCGESGSKQRRIKHFLVVRSAANADFMFAGAPTVPDKELVRLAGFRSGGLNGARLPPMPRYFFNTRIGDELISDPEGEELKNPDHAWEMSRAMIRELLKTEGTDERLLNAVIEVTDDEGEIVLEFPFAEAIDVPDGPITKH
jgi:uncharacterized protein DUF6894